MLSFRTLCCLVVFLLISLVLVRAVAAFGVSYNYRCYAGQSDGETYTDHGELEGETFFAGNFTKTGAPGNYATCVFHADLSTATLSAHTSSRSVHDDSKIIIAATGLVEKIAFEDRLIFSVPAGHYPAGVQIQLQGRVSGTLWSQAGANAQWRCHVAFGGEDFAIDLQEIGIGDEGTIVIDELFTITNQLVAPGATLPLAQDYDETIIASMRRCLSSSPGGASEPGAAEVEFSNGLRLLGLQVPPGVGCVSESGVFPDLPSPVPDLAQSPLRPLLHGNRPNPFNPRTTISYELPAAAAVVLDVYDAAGRRVRNLIDADNVGAGPQEAVWDGRDASGQNVATGVYLYRIEAAGQSEARSMTLLK